MARCGSVTDRWTRYATPRAILIVGWLLFVVYAYPGYLSPDPVLQISQARSGSVGDWHPPVMGILWNHLETFIPGTFGMLVLQSTSLLVGLHVLLCRLLSPRKAAITSVAILLFPPVMTTMAVIWKDSQMAGYMMLGIAFLFADKLRWRLVGCGLLCLATMMRYNALAATLPIFVFLFQWREGMAWWRRYSIAVGMWLVVTFAAGQVNNALADHHDHPWYLGAYHDIAGVLHYTSPRSDTSLERLLPGVLHVHSDIGHEIDRRYLAWSCYYLVFTDDRVFEFPDTDAQRATVRKAWFQLIKNNPAAYLKHRYEAALEILEMTKNPVIAPVWDGFPPDQDTWRFDSIQLAMHHGAWQSWWVRSLQKLGQSLLFRAYLYFFVALALLWPCRRSPLDLALLLSGLCYEGTLFIAAVADSRYSHWMVTCTVLAFVRTVISRARLGQKRGMNADTSKQRRGSQITAA